MRKVTKKEFDMFLNYFQDKYIQKSVIGTNIRYFDNFDMHPLAMQTNDGMWFIWD